MPCRKLFGAWAGVRERDPIPRRERVREADDAEIGEPVGTMASRPVGIPTKSSGESARYRAGMRCGSRGRFAEASLDRRRTGSRERLSGEAGLPFASGRRGRRQPVDRLRGCPSPSGGQYHRGLLTLDHARRPQTAVVVTRKLPDAVETRMMELFHTRLNDSDVPMNREELIRAANESDVLVPTVTDRIDAEVIAAAGPQLRLLASFGAGVDHIDLTAARERGIAVTNTPGVLTGDTADMTMALILAVSRRLAEGERLIRANGWEGWAPTALLGHRIYGKRLGIVGMGRIGTAVARRARGFGISIHYHNRRRTDPDIENELEATYWESLDQMLARMDIVSINCPRTPATFHLLSPRRLALMKPHAYIVNTSRGEVIDENALAEALGTGALAGAALDVFEREPAVDPRLLGLDNVVLLPHMGSATIEGPPGNGRKGHRQHQGLRRRPQPARPCA